MASTAAVRKPLRSRRGCYTCRTKKVKCDEQSQTCGRCRRLQLTCDWKGPPAPKVVTARSKTLAPKLPVTDAAPSFDLDDVFCATPVASPQLLDPQSLELASRCANATQIVELQPQDFASSPWTSSADSPAFDSMTLHAGFEVTARERHAVQHFQTRFSLSRSTKSPLWSTHSLMLYHGMSSPMVMHLVIASSLADLALRSTDTQLEVLAERHYRIGASLLTQSITQERQEHSNVLTCFFLLYVYLSTKDEGASVLSHLSQSTLEYIQRYNLDNRSSSAIANSVSSEMRTFVSRVIIWTLYEDIAISFLGYRAHLANYARENADSMLAVYNQSASTFEACWGSFYPDTEAMDDVENATVLRFLFDVMCLLEHINHAETATEATRIEHDLDALESRSKALIRLTNIKDNFTSRLLINVDWTVALFYALRIYLFRKLDGTVPNTTVQQSLSAMLLIAQRRLSAGRDDMFRRFEAPLFMAAIETKDPIHREWAIGKLTKPRYKRAANKILQLQHQWDVRASWTTVQDVLRGEYSDAAPPEPIEEMPGDFFFLE